MQSPSQGRTRVLSPFGIERAVFRLTDRDTGGFGSKPVANSPLTGDLWTLLFEPNMLVRRVGNGDLSVATEMEALDRKLRVAALRLRSRRKGWIRDRLYFWFSRGPDWSE